MGATSGLSKWGILGPNAGCVRREEKIKQTDIAFGVGGIGGTKKIEKKNAACRGWVTEAKQLVVQMELWEACVGGTLGPKNGM